VMEEVGPTVKYDADGLTGRGLCIGRKEGGPSNVPAFDSSGRYLDTPGHW